MQQIHTISARQIHEMAREMLDEKVVFRTHGWRAYRVLNSDQSTHEPVVVRFGAHASTVLPWVHTLIASVKGTIGAVCHGVSINDLDRYLAEYFYRFNRRFWESQTFDGISAACVGTSTVSYSEMNGEVISIVVFVFSTGWPVFYQLKNPLCQEKKLLNGSYELKVNTLGAIIQGQKKGFDLCCSD